MYLEFLKIAYYYEPLRSQNQILKTLLLKII